MNLGWLFRYQMCLDMETEVLTKKGWARCDAVNQGDEIAGFDMESGLIEWCKAEEKTHRPLASSETMFGVKSPHLDIRVTNQHEMVYRGRSYSCKNWLKREAESLARLKNSYLIPIAGENDGPGLSLTDDEIRFIGWTLTDGHRNPHNNAVIICQSSASPHNNAIISMLEGCGFGFRTYQSKRRGKLAQYADALQYVIPYGCPRGINKGKRGWKHLALYLNNPIAISMEDISQRQLGIMLEAMNLADGSKPRNLPWQQRTMSISIGPDAFLADQLQVLLIRRGYRCNISTQKVTSDWHQREPRKLHILRVRKQTTATVGGTKKRPSSLVKNRCSLSPVPFSRDEWVWCLRNRFGTLVTRRKGKVAILGNCGRGFRLFPGKADCLVLDFGGNVLRHGPVDAIRIKEPRKTGEGEAPAKECPQCLAVIAAGYAVCPDCGFVFPEPERQKHDAEASTAGILSQEVTLEEYPVSAVYFEVHTKRNAPEDAPKTMRVDYQISWYRRQSEWVCFEHSGYARKKAESWWRRRSDAPIPESAAEAVAMAQGGALCETTAITVRSVTGEKYDRIVGYELGEKPFYREPGWDEVEPPTHVEIDDGCIVAIEDLPF